MVEIQENYRDFAPPKSVKKSIERLIRHTSKHHINGLHSIVLTNAKALNRKFRKKKIKSRKKKISLESCAGWYIEKWNNEPAYIELLIDKILSDYPAWVLRIGFISDIALSRTFFHELGHHIHKIQAPEYRESEDVANKWRKRLSRKYFWKRYWYFLIFIWPFKSLFDWLLKRYDEK